jgi:YfiH family protein
MQPERELWRAAQHPLLPENVVAGCTTRAGGCSSGSYATNTYATNNLALHVNDDERLVTANRKLLQTRIGASQIQWLDQVHGSRCEYAKLTDVESLVMADTDAVWTDEPGLALAIMTADCVPVLMWSLEGSVVGGCHAGWRGLTEGVIAQLVDSLPVASERIAAWIGPCISGRYYEVGEDVWGFFRDEEGAGVASHPTVANKRLVDLALIAELQLHALGVGDVTRSGVCTYADNDFFSYRRHCHSSAKEHCPETGRMASVIMLSL